ncbi:LysR family transcriptional regulator [Nonomuraea sediminis]|uniref:LysR family transcriptional regulator n=1 Tax=Nonomuraea sediminis TaxID=2835864 RepID=UPI001BDDC708|nr:LysR family transcriptional regulator [Nonomuraea sediminis]
MERYEIEAFLTLAEELHFGRAAERLGLSKARVSQTISKLERQIGAPLFDRTSRAVRLTPIGQTFRDDLAPGFEQIRGAVERAMAAGRGFTDVLRAGFLCAAAGQNLLRIAERFRRDFPECEVRFRETQIGDGFEGLRDDAFDVLLTTFPVREPDLRSGPVLLSEGRVLAVPSGHPFARRSSLVMADLAGQTVIDLPHTLPDYWVASRIPAHLRHGPVANTHQEILTMVAGGRGVFPLGEFTGLFYARPDVALVPISDGPPLDWGLTWRAAAETARIRAFTQYA